METAEFDIIIFGATGFTGQLVATYLARRLSDQKLSWALAGRSRLRLQRVRKELAQIDERWSELALLEANVKKPETLHRVAARTGILVTTVGPFVRYGRPVAEACVAEGADYVDITGEPHFWVDLIREFHEEARDKELRLVPCCGFDSVPPDLGALFTVSQFDESARRNGVLIEDFLTARGGPSGGTWHSILDALERGESSAWERYDLRSQVPEGPQTNLRPHYDNTLGRWVVPLPSIDPAVVYRSAAERGDYGDGFTFGHFYSVGSAMKLGALAVGAGAVYGLARFEPTRRLLQRWRQPGEGPSKEERANHWFRLDFRGRAGDETVTTRVSGGDPGYEEAAKMLAESALCLATQREELPERYGVLTPASAFGELLIERLRARGITFEVISPRSRVER